MKDRRWLAWFFLVFMFAVDQATKEWARVALRERQSPGFPWPGVLEITLTYNKGIAFGLAQGKGILMTPVAIIIAVVALMYSRRNPQEGSWTHIAMGLLAAGALGNLYDRLFLGHVTDLIYVAIIHFPVFNVADACITVAACMLFLTWSKDLFHKEQVPPPETLESSAP